MRRLIFVSLLLLPLSASAQTFTNFRVYGTAGKSITNWHGQVDVQALHFELGHELSPRTTVGFVFAPMNVWQPRSWFGDAYGDGSESVRAMSASLLLRQTFRRMARTQFYLEGSSGPMVAEKRVPAATSRFNFVTQAGVGLVLNAHGALPIIAGYRFMHISNGGYAPRNPGLNVSALVVGVQLRNATLRRH